MKSKGKEQDALLVGSWMLGKKKGSQAGTKTVEQNHLKHCATLLSQTIVKGLGADLRPGQEPRL